MSSLKNKSIIVTGASGGIGSSIVKKLVENDANVLASGTRIEKLEEFKASMQKTCSDQGSPSPSQTLGGGEFLL